MRVAVLVGLVFACACGGAAPVPVTLAAPVAPAPLAPVDFAASGRIERELAALGTQPERYARAIGLLAELSRCREARDLARAIATKGDDAAKRAATAAVAECDRLDAKPTPDALARMREAFHEARRVEATEPARAEKLYAEAWAAAPSLAAMLGLARAARASGDAALAERSFERALGFAERSGQKATVAVTPGDVSDGVAPVPVDVRDGAATFAAGGWFLRQSFATGAVRVLAAVPREFELSAVTDRFALLVPRTGTEPPRVFEIGVDDELTATPLADLAGADALAISRDGALAAARAGRTVSVVDLAAAKLVAKTTLVDPASSLGITGDHDVVVREPKLVCVLSPPSYGACRADAALRTAPSPYANPVDVVGRRVAFVDGLTAMRVYDVHDARVVRTFAGRFRSVTSLELSPGGETLVSSSPTRDFAWDLPSGKHTEAVTFGWEPVWADDSKRVLLPSTQHGWELYTLATRAFSTAGSLAPRQRLFAFGPSGSLWVAGAEVLSRLDLLRARVESFPFEGNPTDIVVSPDDSLVALRVQGRMGWQVAVYGKDGKLVASGAMMDGAMRFEARRLVVAGTGATEEVLDLDTKQVTTRAASAAQQAPFPSDAMSRDGRWAVKNGEGRLIALEDMHAVLTATIDLAADAFVLTSPEGKITIGGDEASAGCRVGAAWLPLETCRDRLLADHR